VARDVASLELVPPRQEGVSARRDRASPRLRKQRAGRAVARGSEPGLRLRRHRLVPPQRGVERRHGRAGHPRPGHGRLLRRRLREWHSRGRARGLLPALVGGRQPRDSRGLQRHRRQGVRPRAHLRHGAAVRGQLAQDAESGEGDLRLSRHPPRGDELAGARALHRRHPPRRGAPRIERGGSHRDHCHAARRERRGGAPGGRGDGAELVRHAVARDRGWHGPAGQLQGRQGASPGALHLRGQAGRLARAHRGAHHGAAAVVVLGLRDAEPLRPRRHAPRGRARRR
jgi:hypothetical protein